MANRTLAAPAVRRRKPRAAPKKKTLKARLKTILALTTLGVLGAIAAVVIYILFVFVQVSKTLPSIAEIGNFKPSEGTKIYFADGPVMAILASERRNPIKLNEMGKHVVDATIAIEDSRFYEHKGIDYHGIARAVYRDVRGGDLKKEGASTITQQLARNIEELGLSKQKKLSRKIGEAILAVRIEQTFSKDEILENYLNQIYYGAGAYGVEAGAQTYFHKKAKNLSLSEAAMLAGLPQRPSYFSNPAHREAALSRRDLVLDRMVDTGKITLTEAERAKDQKLKIYKAEPNSTQVFAAPYFVNAVVAQLASEESGFGQDALYAGLNIYTTLDSRIQKAAEETLANGIHHYGDLANQGAMVSIDPRTGYIRAMVGGLNYKKDQFNVITQGHRPPGSAFKPIVYTAAFDTGTLDLDSTVRDDPNLPGRTNNGWVPRNYSGKYSYKSMTVLSALKQSINTVAVKAAMETGLPTVIEYAQKLGIRSPLQPYPPMALGANGVRPIELCSAYTAFANGGRRALPTGITKVLAPNGDILYEHQVRFQDTGIQQSTIEKINEGLQEVVLHGTGTAAAEVPNAHGKTGTTSEARDAWFAGYTPELCTVIWASREQRDKNGKLSRKEPYAEMPGATGGHLCCPIWRDFMLKAVPIQQAVDKENAAPPAPSAELQQNKDKKAESKLKNGPLTVPVSGAGSLYGPTNATLKGGPDAANGDHPQPAGDPNAPGEIMPSVPPVNVPAPVSPGAVIPRPDPSAPGPRTDGAPPARRTDAGTAPRMSEPGGRLATPAPVRRSDPGDEMVTVSLCADSHKKATQWCDATIERRMKRREIPGRCRVHKPPPGEGEG